MDELTEARRSASGCVDEKMFELQEIPLARVAQRGGDHRRHHLRHAREAETMPGGRSIRMCALTSIDIPRAGSPPYFLRVARLVAANCPSRNEKSALRLSPSRASEIDTEIGMP